MRPLAIVATHPIQYQTPLYRYLTEQGVPVHVLFLTERYMVHDVGFDRSVTWDIPLLENYSYQFLRSITGQTPERFFGVLNPGLLSAINHKTFSAVLVHGWRSLSMLMAVGRARLGSLPVLYRGETTDLVTSARGVRGKALGWGLRNTAAACLSIGSLNDAFYAAMGVPANRRFLVPYAIDNARFQAEGLGVTRQAARSSLGLKSEGTVVLFAGKLISWKRPEMMLTAFLNSAPLDAQLLFVGTGPLETGLRRQAAMLGLAERVVFAGFLNQSRMPLAYRAADLLVVPSDHEPWGLVVNEAMSLGVPALVSDHVGCAPDLVKGGVTGEVFAAARVDDLAMKLRGLLHDPSRLSEMGRYAREHIDGWSYRECEVGLRKALESVGALP